ncbi:hypothetical protein OsI_29461 [Oryza sativa Indica Group]|uniref:Uncharacterized protein n=1 Tax=Oryza sativa subsp. indica TaxID=39946 RepID=B8BBA7_ORYSI|nr:hypothetical protein OsI_29461 [Oryza sativa Indica Group]
MSFPMTPFARVRLGEPWGTSIVARRTGRRAAAAPACGPEEEGVKSGISPCAWQVSRSSRSPAAREWGSDFGVVAVEVLRRSLRQFLEEKVQRSVEKE